jgi:hypothetical protein
VYYAIANTELSFVHHTTEQIFLGIQKCFNESARTRSTGEERGGAKIMY